jgi:hypothetical protein
MSERDRTYIIDDMAVALVVEGVNHWGRSIDP